MKFKKLLQKITISDSNQMSKDQLKQIILGDFWESSLGYCCFKTWDENGLEKSIQPYIITHVKITYLKKDNKNKIYNVKIYGKFMPFKKISKNT